MAIDQLLICKWTNGGKEDLLIEDPAWEDVETAIKNLNGSEYNDIYLTPDKRNQETYLAVGGGDGKYVLTGSVNNEEFPTFVSPGTTKKEMVSIVIGGQLGDYPDNWITDLEKAIEIANDFFTNGTFSQNISWRNV